MIQRAISLRALLAQIPQDHAASNSPDVAISGIAIDSRAVKPGDLFVSLRGASVDGHVFIAEAIANGAAAIVGDRDLEVRGAPYVRLPDAREALSWLAGAYYNWPGRRLTVIGVTGTDGKTTTATLIHRILETAGIRAGLVSSVSAIIGVDRLDTGFHVTTPDAHDVQRYMSQMVDAGLTHVVLETTSHGWAQHRVDACEFDIGVVTNITHEHLDEHGSYENYRAAKARLLQALEKTLRKSQGNPRLAVINRDDSSFEFLNDLVRVDKVTFGLHQDADLRAIEIAEEVDGLGFTAVGAHLRVTIASNLVGAYNVSNCLAALGATIVGLRILPEIAARGISSLAGVEGRMERIQAGQDFTVIVDFAHTPNALKVTLRAVRAMLRGLSPQPRVILVFGSAGLRDRQKRLLMAETAVQLADVTVLTAEDPRTESLDAILEEMTAGAQKRGGREHETLWRIPDRGEAIRFAMRLARPKDVVLVCGKGHEQSMCFGAAEYPWDDRIAVRAALADLLGAEGPSMPYLPTRDRSEAQWLTS